MWRQPLRSWHVVWLELWLHDVRYGGGRPLMALRICPHSKTSNAGKMGRLESIQKARGIAPIIPKTQQKQIPRNERAAQQGSRG